ncbi:hypothetical protein ENH_00058130 [Eimeria necatrix]|uniref:Uncharacterized protein n=1 Tax=Eimeria necatrix TaxID=51315 RepID=U6N202_9EIME|nr:hypothetical protein ENH_00058130 [Eimeria necatrix]CDJ68784.1 hypothetical protein ENH_00058130 [Eimeria necatrix]
MSAFLQIKVLILLPIPRIAVRAITTFSRPSTLVFSTRRMCWKSAMFVARSDIFEILSAARKTLI